MTKQMVSQVLRRGCARGSPAAPRSREGPKMANPSCVYVCGRPGRRVPGPWAPPSWAFAGGAVPHAGPGPLSDVHTAGICQIRTPPRARQPAGRAIPLAGALGVRARRPLTPPSTALGPRAPSAPAIPPASARRLRRPARGYPYRPSATAR